MKPLRSLFVLLVSLPFAISAELFCPPIDTAFRRVAIAKNETIACRCQEDGFYYNVEGATIECTDSAFPALARALLMLNGTTVGSVRIWGSALHRLTEDMLKTVTFDQLSIEDSELGSVQDKALLHVGDRLTSLSLKGNILNGKVLFQLKPLKKLKKLDLSGNQIGSLTKGLFPEELEELFLDDNQITEIADGALANLRKLKKLSISHNQLTKISKDTFKGLDQVEVLQLHHNHIEEIDSAAFNHMKQLRVIDLGTNQISGVELRGLPRLEKVFLNYNNIASFKEVVFKDLPAIVLISMDRNFISEVNEGDLAGLSRSGRLESLTLAANNISYIAPKALAPIQHVSILALQNNQIDRFSEKGKTSFLFPLYRLQTLMLSHNVIKNIREKDLPKTVTVFAADNNKLENIDPKAFEGMHIQKLYINDNALTHLETETFGSFDMDTLEAVDLSANRWQCLCGKEWLVDWLEAVGERDVATGALGCLALSHCGINHSQLQEEDEAEARRSTWISAAASVLAVASVIILLFIAYFFITDGKHTTMFLRPKRVGSDTDALIPNEAEVLPAKKRTPTTEKKQVHWGENIEVSK